MRWPWTRKPEKRQSAQGYTASLTAAFVSAAENGPQGTPLATAALEAAAGLYAACFAAARLDPDIPALSPSVRALLARNLIRRGEDFHRIYVRDGRLVLSPIGFAYAHGNDPDPLGWIYNVTLYGPTDSRHEWTPAASILHSRYSTDASRPWLGVPPWSWAHRTGELAGGLEARLSEESNAPVGAIIAVPQDGGDGGDSDPLAALKSDMAAAKGRTLLAETVMAGWGEGRQASPSSDYKPNRYGAQVPESSVSLRSEAAQALLAACGVPGALVDARADGTAQREAWRRYAMGPLAGLARCVEDEIARKLDVRARFDFGALWAHDTAGRAASFKSMVAGGMSLERAAALSGLLGAEAG